MRKSNDTKSESIQLNEYLIVKAEYVLKHFEIVNKKQKERIALLCLNSKDQYGTALGIEIIGLLNDFEFDNLLMKLDVEKIGYLETICLIEALTVFPTKEKCQKVLEIVKKADSSRELCLLSCDSLYAHYELVNVAILKELFMKEDDIHVKVALAGILYLRTNNRFFFDYIDNLCGSSDQSLQRTAEDYLGSILSIQ